MTVPCWVRHVGTIGVLVLFATACTENDRQLLDEIGVTRLLLIEPALARQNIPGIGQQNLLSPESNVQVAQWSVASATLRFEDVLINLVVEGQTCFISDTAFTVPISEGPCDSGLLIEAGEDEGASLMLALNSMELRRAEPLDLSRTVDFDVDGVPNDGNGSGSAYDAPCGLGGDFSIDCDDNCPLVSNPDQTDDNGDGIGNACTIVDALQGILRDSDGDGVPDALDNCIWIANPNQANTMGLAAEGISDGIGDACEEQVAKVEIADINGPIELVQLIGGISFVTVDFSEALTCNWESLNCVLDPDQVGICGHIDVFAALTGCP